MSDQKKIVKIVLGEIHSESGYYTCSACWRKLRKGQTVLDWGEVYHCGRGRAFLCSKTCFENMKTGNDLLGTPIHLIKRRRNG